MPCILNFPTLSRRSFIRLLNRLSQPNYWLVDIRLNAVAMTSLTVAVAYVNGCLFCRGKYKNFPLLIQSAQFEFLAEVPLSIFSVLDDGSWH